MAIRRLPLIVLLFLVPTGASSQSAWKSFWQLSGPERCWVITHPFVAGKAKKISVEAKTLSEQMKKDSTLDGDGEGGRVDAFRHAYWMARMSQTFCWKKALKLGEAHEKGNYRQFKKGKVDEENTLPDSVSCAMDLFNNRVGVMIGCQNQDMDTDKLKGLIHRSISEGKMLIVSKNSMGEPLDCNGLSIDLSQFSEKWVIPKCLVPSSN